MEGKFFMKKQISMLMAAALMAGVLAGCGSKEQPAETTTAAVTEETTTVAAATETTTEEGSAAKETTAAADGLKTGMAIVSSMKSSKDAGDKDGNAQVDSVVAAVVVDGDGKIVKCMIDTAQNKMGFTPEGKVIMNDDFKTKKELKEDYNMKAASGIGKEWYEQAEAMEQYVIGKTADEVEGIAVDEDTKPTDADLLSSVTIKIGSYVEAIAEAARDAKAIGTQEGDKLGLGVVTNMDKSKDATADKDGQCQAYTTYVAATTDKDGKITASIIDCTQGTVTFDAAGKITSDLTAGVKTKRQLGDDYGMKEASGIGKEWYEQAAAMEAYMAGKTADQVAAIAVNEDSKPTDADLMAGCTMAIGDFQTCIVKAAADAE